MRTLDLKDNCTYKYIHDLIYIHTETDQIDRWMDGWIRRI
jgi:hypothetical protein